MTTTMTKLAKGDSCIASPGGRWARMKVLRANDDGTYKLLPEDSGSFLDEWDGVTRDEISFDDDALFTKAFDAARGSSAGLDKAAMHAIFRRIGFEVDDAQMSEVWTHRTKTLFEVEGGAAESLVLDRAQAYRFVLSVGVSGKVLDDPKSADASADLYKLYWNGIRMGGRRPEDVGRAIALADLLAPLGLADAPVDPELVASLARFEVANGITLPVALKELWWRTGSSPAICAAHCNNPEPCAPGSFVLRRREDEKWDAALAVRIMTPHQGDHAWWVVFDDGADDGGIWISFEEDGPPVRRVSRSVPFFFWDLYETSRCWEAGNGDDEEEEEEEKDEPS